MTAPALLWQSATPAARAELLRRCPAGLDDCPEAWVKQEARRPWDGLARGVRVAVEMGARQTER